MFATKLVAYGRSGRELRMAKGYQTAYHRKKFGWTVALRFGLDLTAFDVAIQLFAGKTRKSAPYVV